MLLRERGEPAFRSPSINSFAFAPDPRRALTPLKVPKSEMGHSRRFERWLIASALLHTADMAPFGLNGSFFRVTYGPGLWHSPASKVPTFAACACRAETSRVFATGKRGDTPGLLGQPRFPKALNQQLCI